MKRFLIVVLSLVCGVFSLNAQNVERIYAKDGSIYDGYISTQVPGVSVTVTSVSATLAIDPTNIIELRYHTKEVSELSRDMQEWVKLNRPQDTYIEVATVRVGNTKYNEALILDKGVRYKILVFERSKVELKWGQIVKTRKNSNYQGSVSPITDIVTLKNGKSFRGHITEQVIGVELKIKHGYDQIETVHLSEILNISSEVAGNSRTMWSKLPLLDKVELKDGTTLTGFISSRMAGKSVVFNVVNTNTERVIPLTEVAAYHKVENDAYVNTQYQHEQPQQYQEPQPQQEQPQPQDNSIIII